MSSEWSRTSERASSIIANVCVQATALIGCVSGQRPIPRASSARTISPAAMSRDAKTDHCSLLTDPFGLLPAGSMARTSPVPAHAPSVCAFALCRSALAKARAAVVSGPTGDATLPTPVPLAKAPSDDDAGVTLSSTGAAATPTSFAACYSGRRCTKKLSCACFSTTLFVSEGRVTRDRDRVTERLRGSNF